MSNQLVISIITDDRPGVVEQIAAIVTRHQGNWLESALSRLGGKFAGILLVEVARDAQAALESDLQALSSQGIRVTIDGAGKAPPSGGEEVDFEVIGNDRHGIVGEISQVLARHQVSVDEFYTATESAPMSGELLFRAQARVLMPAGMSQDDLRAILEQLSDDLMIEFKEH
ncbi:MAG: ACT domain-containing protein [Porticoccaceae bacterium]